VRTRRAKLIKDGKAEIHSSAPSVPNIFKIEHQGFTRDEIFTDNAALITRVHILEPDCTVAFTVWVFFKRFRRSLLNGFTTRHFSRAEVFHLTC
jgi:hypothetical protein